MKFIGIIVFRPIRLQSRFGSLRIIMIFAVTFVEYPFQMRFIADFLSIS